MYVLAVDVYSVYLEGQFISFIPSVNICVNKMSSFTAHIYAVFLSTSTVITLTLYRGVAVVEHIMR